jgi:hypothetical protein
LAAAAFVITLAISSWHEGLWSADRSAAPRIVRPQALVAAQSPGNPFGPTSARAIQVANVEQSPAPATQSDAPTPPEPAAVEEHQEPATDPQPQTEPYNAPDVDNGEMLQQMDQARHRNAREH